MQRRVQGESRACILIFAVRHERQGLMIKEYSAKWRNRRVDIRLFLSQSSVETFDSAYRRRPGGDRGRWVRQVGGYDGAPKPAPSNQALVRLLLVTGHEHSQPIEREVIAVAVEALRSGPVVDSLNPRHFPVPGKIYPFSVSARIVKTCLTGKSFVATEYGQEPQSKRKARQTHLGFLRSRFAESPTIYILMSSK